MAAARVAATAAADFVPRMMAAKARYCRIVVLLTLWPAAPEFGQ
jgi:hypothetical protein